MTDWTPPTGAFAPHLVIACLEHHAINGEAQISSAALSKLTGVSRRHVQQTIADLERDGILTVLAVGRAHAASMYRLDHPERVSREIVLPTWTAERKEALRSWWPRSFAADLVAPINALPGAEVAIRSIENMAGKMGLKHDKALMGKRAGAGRKRNPGPKRVAAPKPLKKEPDQKANWSPRQTVFHIGGLTPKCAFHGCQRKPVGRWCAEHTAAMRRPADEIVAALEAVA